MMRKFEIRHAKFEANSNKQARKGEGRKFRNSNLFRVSVFAFRILAFAVVVLFAVDAGFAQRRNVDAPPPLSPAEGAREAQALVAEMLAEKPEQNFTNTGLLKIRDVDGNQRETPLRIVTLTTRTNWLQIYEAAPGSPAAITLTIVHTAEGTNQYFISTSSSE